MYMHMRIFKQYIYIYICIYTYIHIYVYMFLLCEFLLRELGASYPTLVSCLGVAFLKKKTPEEGGSG